MTLLHHFGIAHGLVDARNRSHQFAQDTFSDFQYIGFTLEIFWRQLVQADIWIDFHRKEVIKSINLFIDQTSSNQYELNGGLLNLVAYLSWNFCKFLIECIGYIVSRIG